LRHRFLKKYGREELRTRLRQKYPNDLRSLLADLDDDWRLSPSDVAERFRGGTQETDDE
jgi:hypothetical protein